MQQSFSLNNFGIHPSASNPGDGVSEVVPSLSHQRGTKTKKNQKNKIAQNKKTPQRVSSSNAMQFQ
jgi:hypothetical protein